MAQYSLQQQLFALSLIANAGSGDIGRSPLIELELKKAIESFLGTGGVQELIGSWSIAWGPVVYEHILGRATNAMFVASGTDSTGKPVYVVAVAATSPNSPYDLLVEDADITLIPWPYAYPAGALPSITLGTIDGVNALRAMRDPTTYETLQSFLTASQRSDTTVVFTGHSLGGALSPALALSLFGAPANGGMDPAEWAAVYVCPTAGPTVGDAGYASFWASVFPPVQAGGATWNQLVWNTLDVVPHAWALLGSLDTLYPSSDLTWTPCLGSIQGAMLAKVAGAGGTFVQPQNGPLPGTFAPWTGASSSSPMVTYFLLEMLHQHIWAYFDLLNVPELRTFFPRVTDPTASASAPAGITVMCGVMTDAYCGSLKDPPPCGPSSGSAQELERAPMAGSVQA
jgi:Lipase (class 3)